MRWIIPIKVVQNHRKAVVKASTKAEALKKFYLSQWEEGLGDPGNNVVVKTGAIRRMRKEDELDRVHF